MQLTALHDHLSALLQDPKSPLLDIRDAAVEYAAAMANVIPGIAAAREFTAKISRLKIDGELYDSDGNLVNPDEHSPRAIEDCERYFQESDDAITCLTDLIEEARSIIDGNAACHAPTGEKEVPSDQ